MTMINRLTNFVAVGSWLSGCLVLLACSFAFAQGNQDPGAAPTQAESELQKAFMAAQAAATNGPADIKLADHAVLKLPEGKIYVPPAQGKNVMRALGNMVDDSLLGLVFPSEEGANWFVILEYTDSGYIKDDDAKDWNADDLLKDLKAGTDEANKDRAARGIPEMTVLGWIEPPKYDPNTHRLVWSASTKDKAAPGNTPDGVNYNTYALGRQGYISLNLVTGYETIEKDKPEAKALLAALNFNDGKRYTDFNASTDRVAEYGLAALVGGIAAKKLGLFALIAAFVAKFAKVIGIGAIAGGGILAKYFSSRKKSKEAHNEPPPSA